MPQIPPTLKVLPAGSFGLGLHASYTLCKLEPAGGKTVLFQDRNTKVFAAALISMAIGTVVLKTLVSSPIEAGAFSLSEYYHLGSVEKIVSSSMARTSRHWNSIEISYTDTKLIVIDERFSRSDPVNRDVLNYHFIVWNGLIGGDGQMQSTEKWQRQLSTTPGDTLHGSEQTIHIGVMVDGKTTDATDFQIKRTEMLAKALSRRLGIKPASIYYPDNWWQWRASGQKFRNADSSSSLNLIGPDNLAGPKRNAMIGNLLHLCPTQQLPSQEGLSDKPINRTGEVEFKSRTL